MAAGRARRASTAKTYVEMGEDDDEIVEKESESEHPEDKNESKKSEPEGSGHIFKFK